MLFTIIVPVLHNKCFKKSQQILLKRVCTKKQENSMNK
jgi:hypothetical protein